MRLKRAFLLMVVAIVAFGGWVIFLRSMPKGSWPYLIPSEIAVPVALLPVFNFVVALAGCGRGSATRRADGRFYGRPKWGARIVFPVVLAALMALGFWSVVGDVFASRVAGFAAVGFLIILPGIGIVNLLTSHVVWDDETLTVAKLPFVKQTEAWRDLQGVLDLGGSTALDHVTLTFVPGKEVGVSKMIEGWRDLVTYADRRLAENSERHLKETPPARSEGVVTVALKHRLVLSLPFGGLGVFFLWGGWASLPLSGTLINARTMLFFFAGVSLLAYGLSWWFRSIRWDDVGVQATNVWGFRRQYDWGELEAITNGKPEFGADTRILVFSDKREVRVSSFAPGGAELIAFAESKLNHA